MSGIVSTLSVGIATTGIAAGIINGIVAGIIVGIIIGIVTGVVFLRPAPARLPLCLPPSL